MDTDYKALLTKYGLKATIQRILILDYLRNTKEHPTAEMIYKKLQPQYPTLTLSTVYNTLEVFSDKGLIKKVFTPEGIIRYDADLSKHHHLYDEDTDRILDLYDDELTRLIEDYIKQKDFNGYQVLDFQVEFRIKSKH